MTMLKAVASYSIVQIELRSNNFRNLTGAYCDTHPLCFYQLFLLHYFHLTTDSLEATDIFPRLLSEQQTIRGTTHELYNIK